ncbi:hypothetical protein TNCV_408511 [Trichonephila clavipes]|nr:hypothetical protein TNCV_408511 [Trichonephila clavipes]
MRSDIWQLLPKETDGARNHSLQPLLRQFQGRPCTDLTVACGLSCNRILARLSYGEGKVSVTTKKSSVNDAAQVLEDSSFDNLVALNFKYDQARRRFVKRAQNEIAVVPDFHKRILFSDEAHFWLNGYVNKQNCRIWSEANPQVYVETPLHPEKLTVWCALWAGGILLQKR